MPKKIIGKESRKVLLEAVKQVAAVIGSTMSAKGRNVLIETGGSPAIINDGVTVLNQISYKDPLANMAVQILKEAANRTNHLAGDGTSGTVVLTAAILERGMELVEGGANPVLLRRDIEKVADSLQSLLKGQAKKVNLVERAIQIASVSVQDGELGRMIGELIFGIGPDAAVDIQSALKPGVEIDKAAGMRLAGSVIEGAIDRAGWVSKMNNPHILVLEDEIQDNDFVPKIVPFIRNLSEPERDAQGRILVQDGKIKVLKVNTPYLVIVAEKLCANFVEAMNQNLGYIKYIWFRPTTAEKNMKEIYKDLRAMIGGEVVNESEGVYLAKMKVDDLGRAKSIVANRYELVVVVDEDRLHVDSYLDRVNEVKEQVKNADDEDEELQIKQRLANLTGGVAVIKVAAATHQDTTELKLRIEDAVNATRVAMEEGYLPGGGVALFDASRDLMGITPSDGRDVLMHACRATLKQILENVGEEDAEAFMNKELIKYGQGLNVLTGKVEDMSQAGVIDPLKVIRLALEHAVSVAGLLLTSEYAIVEEQDEVDDMIDGLVRMLSSRK